METAVSWEKVTLLCKNAAEYSRKMLVFIISVHLCRYLDLQV